VSAPSASIPRFPARRGSCPFEPAPDYTAVREQNGITKVVMWNGATAWVVTRYSDVRMILSDQKRFSADGTREGFIVFAPGVPANDSTFIRMDDPEHARLRRMLAKDFTARRAMEMRPEIQAITDRFIDHMLSCEPPVDLVSEFALPLPSLVISSLLGVPYSDHDFFEGSTRKIMSWKSSGEAAGNAMGELLGYLSELASAKLAEPGDDVLSNLVTNYEVTGELSREDIVKMAMLLLIAGHETSANMISAGIAALLTNPDQLAALRSDETLIPNAVEELLRYLSVVHSGLSRITTEDVEIAGELVPAGANLILHLPTANHDDTIFSDPTSLDIARDAKAHLAFGHGVHQCIGRNLAKVEIEVAIGTLLRRLPDLALAVPLEEIPFREDMFVYGVHKLPVTWSSGASSAGK
jgi:cytochrome P450